MGGVREDITFNYGLLMSRNITIRGNFMYGNDAPHKLRGLLEGGLLSLKGLSTTVFAFEDLEKGIQFAGKHGGAVLRPSER
jgi:threonine dehydrogenase-like Zn-dependent dehydrogenase